MKDNIEIEFDNALNEAGWCLVAKLQESGEVNGKQFNNLKSYLKLAIETYLNNSDLKMNIDKVETQSEHQEEMSALISANRMNESVDEFLAGLKDENEWNGEGLPTVGVECEIYCPVNPVMPDGDKDWMKTEIVAIIDCGFGAETTVVYKTPWSAQWYVDAHPSSALKFRKPETKQQREDRERLEAAYDLYCTAQNAVGLDVRPFEEFKQNSPQMIASLAIVDKTNYRKGVK